MSHWIEGGNFVMTWFISNWKNMGTLSIIMVNVISLCPITHMKSSMPFTISTYVCMYEWLFVCMYVRNRNSLENLYKFHILKAFACTLESCFDCWNRSNSHYGWLHTRHSIWNNPGQGSQIVFFQGFLTDGDKSSSSITNSLLMKQPHNIVYLIF